MKAHDKISFCPMNYIFFQVSPKSGVLCGTLLLSVDHRLRASTLSGSLVEMPIIGSHFRPTESTSLRMGHRDLYQLLLGTLSF